MGQPLYIDRLQRVIASAYKSRFVRNVAVVASGTAAAQAIGMAFSPLITRLYGPEAFGLLGIYTSLLGVLGPITALTVPVAIVLPKDDDEAKRLAFLSLFIATGMVFSMAFLLVAGGSWFITPVSYTHLTLPTN